MYCENCKIEHGGSYGSGRFCSSKCARGFSTKAKRKEINEKVRQKLSKPIKIFESVCKHCNSKFIRENVKRTFCSISCATSYANARRTITDKTKKRLSESGKRTYETGKEVYGGRTKWYTVETSNGKTRVQGTYEKRTCKILDKWKEQRKIRDWEYTNDRYQYLWEDGTEHAYLLDFKIYENDGTFWYLETKGYIRENDERKWEALEVLGHRLEIWFLEDIEKQERGFDSPARDQIRRQR